jgi:hypothetical protein
MMWMIEVLFSLKQNGSYFKNDPHPMLCSAIRQKTAIGMFIAMKTSNLI